METLYDVLKVIFISSAFIGGVFLIVVPIGSAVALSDGLRGRMLRRVPEWTMDDLLTVKARPRRVAVRAAAVAGPDVNSYVGYRAPASGTPCLWFRLTLLRVDKVSTENGDRWNEVVVWSYLSGHTVWFHDGTGTMPVDVSLLEMPVAGKAGLVERPLRTRVDGDGPPDVPYVRDVPRSALRRTRATENFTLMEEVVRTDVTATLFARPTHRDGQLVLSRGRGYRVGVTGLTHTEVADRYSGEAREGWWGVRAVLIIGLVAYLCGMGGALLTEAIR